ncbi:hypothetical protein RDWZM_005650 [Blomia tropicalis]|uniref:Glucuronosyltransferase n=1 Tax=Blomia tropicalis TaxID=40697 RepID=A0A9Q0M762_BLOTA|nr:hypothetical protein RDWZM_005650 [Blomia tropicalis]
MGCINLELMEKIIDILGKTSHKYIISKGPRAEEYKPLPANCWGDAHLPQMNILPMVDLVITHGGNNTVTESFTLGKPMIIMPLMGDQFDNAQRLHDKGFGIRMDPFNFTEQELIDSINKLINDHSLKGTIEPNF